MTGGLEDVVVVVEPLLRHESVGSICGRVVIRICREEREERIPVVDNSSDNKGVHNGIHVPILVQKMPHLLRGRGVPELLRERRDWIDILLPCAGLVVPDTAQEIFRLCRLLRDCRPLLLYQYAILVIEVVFQEAAVDILHRQVHAFVLVVDEDLSVSAPRHLQPHSSVQTVRQTLPHQAVVVHHPMQLNLLHAMEASLVVVLVEAYFQRKLLAQPLIPLVAAFISRRIGEAELEAAFAPFVSYAHVLIMVILVKLRAHLESHIPWNVLLNQLVRIEPVEVAFLHIQAVLVEHVVREDHFIEVLVLVI
mmetsp:Transcript_2136/g.3328  ORF Transcript_2136/g.3328 Transcript_2136/m.3328 type:complete len:308 (-) Transcript_2136:189-1112(-)